MKLALWLCGVVVLGWGLRIVQRSRFANHESPVSEDWLASQQRVSLRNTYEGSAISWPINKVKNEHAGFNAQRLRQRA